MAANVDRDEFVNCVSQKMLAYAVGRPVGKDEVRQIPGLEGNLRPYERWRRGHNLLTGEIMTGFHHLFGSSLAPVALGRNLGFALTDRATPLKRAFIRYASGFAFELPGIAREVHTTGA